MKQTPVVEIELKINGKPFNEENEYIVITEDGIIQGHLTVTDSATINVSESYNDEYIDIEQIKEIIECKYGNDYAKALKEHFSK